MGSVGKIVGDRRYIAVGQLAELPSEERSLFDSAVGFLPADVTYNLVRLDCARGEVAFLSYPALGSHPFPSLHESWRVHVATRVVSKRSYKASSNPPILHRTELLLPTMHPKRCDFERLTVTCEEIGLFDNTTIIGFQHSWNELIKNKGYVLDNDQLVPLGNDVNVDDTSTPLSIQIERHRTALSRASLSAPVQCLIRDQLLTNDKSFFDYGCGKGDDIAALSFNGFTASGWDPHFKPDADRTSAAVVNLGFVINVIEDFEERVDALSKAFALSKEVLVVSAMLMTNVVSKFASFKDGVVTSRATFQKYYTQGELQHFIESVLGEDAYSAAPGVFYVFKDRNLEQRYLLRKTRGISPSAPIIRFNRVVAPARAKVATKEKCSSLPTPEAREQLDKLWLLWLELGRPPAPDEIEFASQLILHWGSVQGAIKKCREANDLALLENIAAKRRDDMLVMLALRSFERRRRLEALDPIVARSIRHFFGSMREAEQLAHDVLFSIQDTTRLLEAARTAAVDGLGYLEDDQALHLHTSLLPELPAVLRVYVGCASAMAGDLASFDMAKLHIQSGKVTLLKYDDFSGKPLPALVRRLKVRLRDQDSDIFEYGTTYPSTLLFGKSKFINEEFPNYAEQIAFEEALADAGLVDTSAHGPSVADFLERARVARYRIEGFQLLRSNDIPSLDDPCGAHYRFRDFIECGETWQRERPDNVPCSPDTYNALSDLARRILDPVIDYYGSVQLTYGFASAALTRHIEGRIAPKLDQHASCEVGRMQRHICERRGAAVDFLVEYENMKEVALWIATNCPFDRMYLYGPDRPIHVSFGPDRTREIYEMVEHGERRVPRRIMLD